MSYTLSDQTRPNYRIEHQNSETNVRPGMVGLAPKWVRLAPNGTNPGLFQIRFLCIWRHFGAKPTITDVRLNISGMSEVTQNYVRLFKISFHYILALYAL